MLLPLKNIYKFLLLFPLLISGSIDLLAKSPTSINVNQAKAGIIFHLSNMVEWPRSKGTENESIFKIGVCMNTDDSLIDILKKNISFLKIHGRKTEIVELDYALTEETKEKTTDLNLLLFTENESEMDDAFMNFIFSKPILTIGETSEFVEEGGMVSLIIQKNKIGIQANPKEIENANLFISSEFLRHVKIVETKGENEPH